jgi:signal transduction histidine kinase
MQAYPEQTSEHLSEALWQSLFEHMSNGVIYARVVYELGVAVDFVYLAVNPMFLRATGLGNVVGHRASEAIPDLLASNPELLERYARVSSGGPPEKFEVYIGAVDHWYEISLQSPYSTQFIAIFTDTSAHRRADALNISLRAQLQQSHKMAAFGLLSAGAAHDCNNMLMAVLGFVDLAARQCGNSDASAQQRHLYEARSAAQRAHRLLEKMLRPDAPQQDAAVVPELGLRAAIEVNIAMLEVLMPNGIVITTELTDVAPVAVSEIDLQQMLMNLVINGRDAILSVGTFGSVEIALRSTTVIDAHCESCHRQFSGAYTELAVSDSGSDIATDALHAMFLPYVTTKGPDAGSGLGLSVVAGLVHAVDGHIIVEDRRPQGTSMRLLFKT